MYVLRSTGSPGWAGLLVAGVEDGDSRADEPDTVVATAVVVVDIVEVVVVVATVNTWDSAVARVTRSTGLTVVW